MLGTRHKVSGPQNADVRRKGNMKTLLSVVSILALLTQVWAEDVREFTLSDVLPIGDVQFEIMTIAPSERSKELTLKFQAAIADDQEWWLEHLKKAKPGEPIDYDPRLGLTQDEFEELSREVKKMSYISTGKVIKGKITEKSGVIQLDFAGPPTPLSDIRIDLEALQMNASVGKVGIGEWGRSDREDIPIGPWEGYSWKFEEGDLEAYDIKVVSLEILRLQRSGKILWYFKDKEAHNKQMVKQFEVMLQHNPKEGYSNKSR